MSPTSFDSFRGCLSGILVRRIILTTQHGTDPIATSDDRENGKWLSERSLPTSQFSHGAREPFKVCDCRLGGYPWQADAYSGDVINTASRIQSKCNGLGVSILLSKFLLDKLNLGPGVFSPKLMGDIQLRGKEQALALYAVS